MTPARFVRASLNWTCLLCAVTSGVDSVSGDTAERLFIGERANINSVIALISWPTVCRATSATQWAQLVLGNHSSYSDVCVCVCVCVCVFVCVCVCVCVCE